MPKSWAGERVAIKATTGEKMSLTKFRLFLPFIFLLSACNPVPVQHAPGSTPYSAPQPGITSGAQPAGFPQSVTQPQTQVTGSERGQYIWDKALEGMVMGGSLAGPYGAGGGLIIGLLAGLFTADAHYARLDMQIQSEQAKDKELEARIEQEMQRQRELEAQLANSAGNPVQQNQAEPPQSAQTVTAPNITAVAMKDASSAVAPLSRTESSSNSVTRPFKNVEVKDINGDNIPDLWIYYNPLKSGEIVRQEEATHWDGRVDTWTYFSNGKLVRREVDTKGKGAADTVYYYENDKIAREDRDENGSGHVSFRALYQNGRLAKVEKDTRGGGKTDLWIYYDTKKDGEIVLKEERDLNGDGALDLWSYYEDGRLVRRDLSAVGLELLSKQDRLPFFPAEPKKISRPELVREDKGRL
jgi:antitoxin component YwqK of YwqJK toxin-antitoxin module